MFTQNALFGITLVLAMIMYIRNVALKQLSDDYMKWEGRLKKNLDDNGEEIKTRKQVVLSDDEAIEFGTVRECAWRLLNLDKNKLLRKGLQFKCEYYKFFVGKIKKLMDELVGIDQRDLEERGKHDELAKVVYNFKIKYCVMAIGAGDCCKIEMSRMIDDMKTDVAGQLLGLDSGHGAEKVKTILLSEISLHHIDLIVVLAALLISTGYVVSEYSLWSCFFITNTEDIDAVTASVSGWAIALFVFILLLPFSRYRSGLGAFAGLILIVMVIAWIAYSIMLYILPSPCEKAYYLCLCDGNAYDLYKKSVLSIGNKWVIVSDIIVSLLLWSLVFVFVIFHLNEYDGRKIARYCRTLRDLKKALEVSKTAKCKTKPSVNRRGC